MKVGSLITRLPNTKFYFVCDKTNSQMRQPSPEVPIGEPVVLLAWRYAEKENAEMFQLFIEGYSDQTEGIERYHYWYGASKFVEIQPPMDMSFIEKMQLNKTVVKML